MEEDCPICLESLKYNSRKIHTTECNHKFHAMCFKKVKAKTCPCCRAEVSQDINSIIRNIRSHIKDIRYAFAQDKITATRHKTEIKKDVSMIRKNIKIEVKILRAVVSANNTISPILVLESIAILQLQTKMVENIQIKLDNKLHELFLIELNVQSMFSFYNNLLLEQYNSLHHSIKEKESLKSFPVSGLI